VKYTCLGGFPLVTSTATDFKTPSKFVAEAVVAAGEGVERCWGARGRLGFAPPIASRGPEETDMLLSPYETYGTYPKPMHSCHRRYKIHIDVWIEADL
jgi:hypothetical protein